MYSMMANLTRHLVSSASSTMAGSRDWDSWLMPITGGDRECITPTVYTISDRHGIESEDTTPLLTDSRLDMMLRRTSGHCRGELHNIERDRGGAEYAQRVPARSK